MTVFLNIITIFLCLGTIGYCYLLSKQLYHFKHMRKNISSLIEEMIKTTGELNFSFEKTKNDLDQNYAHLQDKIEEASFLGDYLDKIIQGAKVNISLLDEHHQKIKALQNKDISAEKDPLEEVMPRGLGRPIKRPSTYIIPGEEYI